jgi:hypothetical protein
MMMIDDGSDYDLSYFNILTIKQTVGYSTTWCNGFGYVVAVFSLCIRLAVPSNRLAEVSA